jgi:uncharacterized membrane protein
MAASAYVEFYDGAYSNFRIVDIAAVGYQYLMSVVTVVLVAGVFIAMQAQWLAARRTKAKAKIRSGSR